MVGSNLTVHNPFSVGNLFFPRQHTFYNLPCQLRFANLGSVWQRGKQCSGFAHCLRFVVSHHLTAPCIKVNPFTA